MPIPISKVSIVIPAKNEAQGLSVLLPQLVDIYAEAEIIVVNDGSTDATAEVCGQLGVNVVNHHYSRGNGAAVKSGARAATGDVIVFMDADGQHEASHISMLLDGIESGLDMVIGARDNASQANIGRSFANRFYNRLASWMVNYKIQDLTSGFRAVDAKKFKQFLYLLPNGFSYPTTITMAFFRSGYAVGYVPITCRKRLGKSHLNIWTDGIRFLLIIFKIATLFSPFKLFIPISFVLFVTGVSYYGYTYFNFGRFTNMSALLFSTSLLIFMMGLVSEQITSLMYSKTHND